MNVKIRKLSEQLNVPADEQVATKGGIFAGVSILVDGFTKPTALELRDLIVANGGEYLYYPTNKITHVITINLPDAKVKELRTQKIVHPDWIVDSCRDGILRPWTQYQLYRNLVPSQRSIADVFKSSSSSTTTTITTTAATAVASTLSSLAMSALTTAENEGLRFKRPLPLPDDEDDGGCSASTVSNVPTSLIQFESRKSAKYEGNVVESSSSASEAASAASSAAASAVASAASSAASSATASGASTAATASFASGTSTAAASAAAATRSPPRPAFTNTTEARPMLMTTTDDVDDVALDDIEGEGDDLDDSRWRRLIQMEESHMQDEWVQRNISTHPDFLDRYFKSSRLHHLSTWKNDFTRLVSVKVFRCCYCSSFVRFLFYTFILL
jgi:hypothetical protein